MNSISSFELSEAMHIIEGAQSCNICGEGFTHPESFEKHKLTHRIDEQYSCKVCSKDFAHEHQLKQHQIMHITNKPFKCNICEATFGRSGDLTRHLRSHTVPESTTYNNDIRATGQDKPSHNHHNHLYQNSHQNNHPPSGQQCDKKLEEQLYKCHVCGCKFSRSGNLSRHMRTHMSSSHSHHNKSHGTNHPHRHHHHHHHHHHHQHRSTPLPIQENNYGCHGCKCSFAHKGNPTRHFRRHEEMQARQPGNNNRENCNRIAQSNVSTDGKNPFNCKACWKAFTDHPGADTHARIHAALMPFKCEACDKVFRDSCARERHQRTHLNKKNFTCDLCHKSFSQKSSLKLHARTHTGERPFMCDICGFAFARKDHLERHLKPNKGDRKLSCVPKHLQQPSALLQQQHQVLPQQQQSQIPLTQQQQSQPEELLLQTNPVEDHSQINVSEAQLQPSLPAQSPIATQTSESLQELHSTEQVLIAQAQPENISSSQQQQLTPSEHSEIPQYLNI